MVACRKNMEDGMDNQAANLDLAKRAYTLGPAAWRLADEMDGVIRQCPDADTAALETTRDVLRGFATMAAAAVDQKTKPA